MYDKTQLYLKHVFSWLLKGTNIILQTIEETLSSIFTQSAYSDERSVCKTEIGIHKYPLWFGLNLQKTSSNFQRL